MYIVLRFKLYKSTNILVFSYFVTYFNLYVMFSNSDARAPGMELQDRTIDLNRELWDVTGEQRPENILYETQQCQVAEQFLINSGPYNKHFSHDP